MPTHSSAIAGYATAAGLFNYSIGRPRYYVVRKRHDVGLDMYIEFGVSGWMHYYKLFFDAAMDSDGIDVADYWRADRCVYQRLLSPVEWAAIDDRDDDEISEHSAAGGPPAAMPDSAVRGDAAADAAAMDDATMDDGAAGPDIKRRRL